MKIVLVTLAISLGAIFGGHLHAYAADTSSICTTDPSPLCETYRNLQKRHR